jgi:putative DNA primase/helicase
MKKWIGWDACRWSLDKGHYLQEGIESVIRATEELAKQTDDIKEADYIRKYAKSIQSAQKIGAMRDLAARMRGISVELEELDSHSHLFNVPNGTIDLRTGDLLQHDRTHLITKLCPTMYNPGAEAPLFTKFLTEIMNNDLDLVSFIQRCVGYSIIGDRNDEKLFLILHGTGANGKSTLLETIRSILGPDYAVSTPTSTLLKKRTDTIPNDVARLRGARLVTASETNEGRGLDASLVKRLTGGDPIDARYMRGEWFTFMCTFVLWLATNHRPEITDDSEGIWDRVKLVPFEVRIPKHLRDLDLHSKMVETESEGILAWAIKGAVDYQTEGLSPPSKVLTATGEYRSEQDELLNFLDEVCKIDMNNTCYRVRTKDLYDTYREWATRQGDDPIGKKRFNQKMTNRGFVRKPYQGHPCWRGLHFMGLEDEEDTLGPSTRGRKGDDNARFDY